MHRRIVIILAIALLALPAWAATLQRLDFDEMIEKSTAIVRGQVVASSARFHGPVIYTHYRLRVLEQIKGAEAAEVDVVVPGGVANGLRQAFAGAPKLQAGSEYVLFLWTGASGLTTIMGFSQGLFDVHRDIAGGAFAARMATSEAMLDNLGRLVRDEPLRIRFEELRSRVRAAAARGVVR
ncbi:MAG: hypothetical protein FJW34_25135 [Acidobacteria bacterium]|nr:hypothetical protein [Acidobacteriota bacterium]